MLVVKLLGIRFLWVDALCIIQDQSDDWMFMAPKMDSIYGNSTLNLCAAAGNNQEHGVPGSPNTPRHALQPIAQFAGLNLVTVKTVESLIEDTVWNSRAWTFQERMLSRRSIIFVDNRVFFQCRQATWSEEVFSENRTPSWTLEMVRSPLQMFEKNPVRLYLECVELFSGRALTYEMDRLPAFEGISAVLCPPLRASFFWGLPDSYFDLALLWENKVPTQRLGQPNHNNQDIRQKSGYPSWSWSGWHGASTWRLSMVSGVLMNVHHWLKSHTWIVCRWHGYGGTKRPYGRQEPMTDKSDEELLQSVAAEPKPTFPTVSHLLENCLYFWTYTGFFQLSRQSRSTSTFESRLEPGLHRFGLLDANGDWCGTIVLEDTWFARVGDIVEFAAISDARDFSMEELDSWNYYVPEDRDLSEWFLYYAFLLVWDKEHCMAERAVLAKIYQRAFNLASFRPDTAWREIVLG
ncbi:hypothetical protein LZ30DRAFT_753827 [Colletotrichum cereale]|nr:hypothetical protein LZ30DRAFT_753827 [Colletotrichum cereale]